MTTTETQAAILRELGFDPSDFAPESWAVGAFARDEIPIAVRDLPYLPAVNEILKRAGFEWDPDYRSWFGRDETARQVEILQALKWCSQRAYPWRKAWDYSPGSHCPVRIGVYEAR